MAGVLVHRDSVAHYLDNRKIVFGSQLKSVVGETMDYSITSETGEVVDAVFSNRSLSARIVNSPYILGTTATLLAVIAKKAVELYRK